MEHFQGWDRWKDFRGWCGRTMGWSEHPLLSHPLAQVPPTPVSSVLSPIPGTSRMQQKRTPEAVVIKNTRRIDNIRRWIIAKI